MRPHSIIAPVLLAAAVALSTPASADPLICIDIPPTTIPPITTPHIYQCVL